MNNSDMPASSTSLEISERYEEGYYDKVALGLTKREMLAAMAMQGIISNSDMVLAAKEKGDSVAAAAVFFADALLKELAK